MKIKKLAGKKILLIGDTIIDTYIYCKPGELSREAPIIKFIKEREVVKYGGAWNVYTQLRALGADVFFITNFVPDPVYTSGQFIRGFNVLRVPLLPTKKTRIISKVGDRSMLTQDQVCCFEERPKAPEAPNLFSHPDYVRYIGKVNYNAVVLSNYGKPRERTSIFDLNKVQDLYLYLRGYPLIVDSRDDKFTRSLLHYHNIIPDVITPNENEALVLESSGWAKNLVRKLGCKGMQVVPENSPEVRFPVYDAGQVTTTIGAGDIVTAVLSLATAAGMPILDAAKLANIAAGIYVHTGTVVTKRELVEACKGV